MDNKENQKDNNTDELVKILAAYLAIVRPLFNRLSKKSTDKLKAVSIIAEATPSAKRKSKRFLKQMQDSYISDVLPDIKKAQVAQDLIATTALANTFEYGFNSELFTLEQKTQTAVNIPTLNRKGVVNACLLDWVGDGHTYSDRIRINTALVADGAKEAVKEVITKKCSYNNAAHTLANKINESYGNAVRIIRTEMTRVNGLGASYAAMANADLYEGKRRDATYDSRTSAMCAADADYSAVNPYPVDYDTPTNPAPPGHRIPNHPNCRCRWEFIVQGIGNKCRGKIARDENDRNYYTEAETFDEYAKERGLPSVQEMLEKDNPKRYIRPGESLENLEKELKTIKSGAKNTSLFGADLDNSRKSGIIKVKGVNNMYSGGLSGALNPNSERAMQHAERYYAEVRKMTTDCKKIAKNTGWKESSITQIKDHLFYSKHDLGGLEAEYFDADYDIAISWQNLIDGRIEEKDIVLLKHEYLELHIMKSKHLPYAEAHKQAEEKHNYGLALKEWRSKL